MNGGGRHCRPESELAAQVARIVAEGSRSLCQALLAGFDMPSGPALSPALMPEARGDGVDPYLVWRLAEQMQEMIVCLFYGPDGAFIAEYARRGTATAVMADRSALSRRAVGLCARYVVLAHNHPSGEARPSARDIETTRQIYRLFEALGMRLVDHAIVARGGASFSFLRQGLV